MKSSMDANTIEIRAHHLLCMQGFQGRGYSFDFVDNMSKIIKVINEDPESFLIITSECDSICRHCPHNRENICVKDPDSFEKIKNMDKLVLKKINLKEEEKVIAKDVFSLVNEKIGDKHGAREICGNCAWEKECLWPPVS